MEINQPPSKSNDKEGPTSAKRPGEDHVDFE